MSTRPGALPVKAIVHASMVLSTDFGDVALQRISSQAGPVTSVLSESFGRYFAEKTNPLEPVQDFDQGMQRKAKLAEKAEHT